jgi:TonB-linked SusC/RagA family outer membrane protein
LVDGQETIVYRPLRDESIGGVSSIGFGRRSKRVYLEAALQYGRSFNKHNVGGLILYTQNKQWWHGLEKRSLQYPEVPIGYMGAVARFTYDYDYRYLFEFSIGRNGSENFPEESRFGTFPAVSAGWNVTREPFVQQLLGENKILSLLKFRASYGETGNDKSLGYRFLYFPSEYLYAPSRAVFGEEMQNFQGVYEGKLGNPNITWEKAVKQNYAVESAFFNNKLSFNFDYFIDYRNNILNSKPVIAHVAAAIQDVYNVAKVRNKGYEITLGWKDKIGQVNYWINGNYTFARNVVLYNAQAQDPDNPNTWTTGISLNQTLGLIADGFFNTQQEADAWPIQFASSSTPGDVRYIDINGDGVINERDVTPIGAPVYPEVNYGSSMGLSYKGFDFSVLLQGAARVSSRLSGYMREPGKLFAGMLEEVKAQRWTPENMENATRPKLTATYANASNYQVSSLWQRDASYLRVKNVEFGYKFNSTFLNKLKISSARLYVSGQNLFTWDEIKLVDPEQNPGNSFKYPQLRVFNAGLSVQF